MYNGDSNGSGHHYTSSQRLLTPSSERPRVTATHLLPQIREFGDQKKKYWPLDQQSASLTTSDHAGHSYVGNLLGIYWKTTGNPLGMYWESTGNPLGVDLESSGNLLLTLDTTGNLLGTTGNLLWIYRELLGIYLEYTGNLLGIYWESTGNLPEIYWAPTGNLQGIYWESTVNLLGIHWKSTGNLLGRYRELLGIYLESTGNYWESTGNTQGIYWESKKSNGNNNKYFISPNVTRIRFT